MRSFNVIIILIGALSGLTVVKIQPTPEFSITWLDALKTLLIAPPSVLLLCGMELLRSPTNLKWHYPSFYSEPMDFSQPLSFIFTVGWASIASGTVGITVGTLMSVGSFNVPIFAFIVQAFVLGCGIGSLLGVKLATIVFRSKMKKPDS
jgi:hypothetical protein